MSECQNLDHVNSVYMIDVLLNRAISDAFDKVSKIFRSGRYGFNSNVAQCLIELGYVADSSIIPFWNWSALVLLAKKFVKSKHKSLLLDFHSSSFLPGNSPYVPTIVDLKRFLNAIEIFPSVYENEWV